MALSWLEHFIGFSLGSIIMASSWYLTKIWPREMVVTNRVQGYENTMQCLWSISYVFHRNFICLCLLVYNQNPKKDGNGQYKIFHIWIWGWGGLDCLLTMQSDRLGRDHASIIRNREVLIWRSGMYRFLWPTVWDRRWLSV
jgi:hypothetical protein